MKKVSFGEFLVFQSFFITIKDSFRYCKVLWIITFTRIVAWP